MSTSDYITNNLHTFHSKLTECTSEKIRLIMGIHLSSTEDKKRDNLGAVNFGWSNDGDDIGSTDETDETDETMKHKWFQMNYF